MTPAERVLAVKARLLLEPIDSPVWAVAHQPSGKLWDWCADHHLHRGDTIKVTQQCRRCKRALCHWCVEGHLCDQ